jgi:hypothetical protein
MNEAIQKTALKEANTAFQMACTLREEERIEVYTENGAVLRSSVLKEDEMIAYGKERVLLYRVFGNDYLEAEIRAWIDQARSEEHPEGLALNIKETLELIVKQTGKLPNSVSSNEIFATLSLNVIEQIETAILAYWWENKEEENAKSLAAAQIAEALKDH